MPNVTLITVHGMGVTLPDYAAGLVKRLREKLGPASDQGVEFLSVYYQKILQDNERALWNRVDAQSSVHYDELRKFLLFGFGDAAGLENNKEDKDSSYEQAQKEIANQLLTAYRNSGEKPVVFISHSLGCQVLSSYIYDAQKASRGEPVEAGIWKDINASMGSLTAAEKNFLAAGTCMAWITTGCNIPIFVAPHKDIIPIKPPSTPSFKWLNIYDPDDVLGWPLQPLSDSYRALVEDRAINAGRGMVNWILKGWNPMSHSCYWDDDEVVDPLARMLRQLMT